ncbi:GH26 endo-beta-1,4-mannanase [Kalaharituber pfeilii]|nr:GH26 endo-beta-1,4-mannanase [Kalaharituber pfeilii]
MFSRTILLSLLAVVASFPSAFAVVYEAENGALSGTTIGTSVAGYSGTGYVEGFDTETDSLTFTVTSTSGGLYDLKIRYSAPYGSKYTRLSLNGGGGGEVSLPETTEWLDADAGQVLLNAGSNKITLINHWGWYLIDSLSVTESAPRPPHQVKNVLVNPAATSATKGLLSYLLSQSGTNILSGQQEISSITWLEQNVGKTPAIAGLDMIDYSPSRVERGTVGTSVEEAIAFEARRGIVTFVWHWNAPTGLIDTAGKEWWRGFYTEATTFDVQAALAEGPSGANYQLLIRDIDAIATQLKRLQTANVPVLWRPLHEAEGGWFWWGAKGAEPCKQLWRIVYDRMTNYHKLNNLIWIWNSVDPAWYPGADVVDIVSYDSYPAAGDHGPVSTQFSRLVSLTNDTKLIAMSEVGSIPDPQLVFVYGLRWSWFCAWSGDFISGGSHNSLTFLQYLYNHAKVITLDKLPSNWKNGGSTSTSTTTAAPASTTTRARTSTRTTSITTPTSTEGQV